MKKLFSLFLSLLLLLTLSSVAFAQEVPPLASLDNSTISSKHYAFTGIENYVVIYPEPEEAEERFDIRNAVIICGDDSVISVRPEKVEEYRFGSVLITGKKLGTTTVTVKDPKSGVSCSFKVVVLPGFLLRLSNFFNRLQYLPYFIGMRILSIFNR